MLNLKFKYWPQVIGIIVCLLIGMVGAMATRSADYAWYASLNKPSFNPPDWVFAPVWTILYVLIGSALGIVWKIRKQYPAIFTLFIMQLILNALWSVIFFQFHQIAWAFLDLFTLWLVIGVLLISLLKPAKTASLLLFPYWCWVSFALVLNATLLVLASQQ